MSYCAFRNQSRSKRGRSRTRIVHSRLLTLLHSHPLAGIYDGFRGSMFNYNLFTSCGYWIGNWFVLNESELQLQNCTRMAFTLTLSNTVYLHPVPSFLFYLTYWELFTLSVTNRPNQCFLAVKQHSIFFPSGKSLWGRLPPCWNYKRKNIYTHHNWK